MIVNLELLMDLINTCMKVRQYLNFITLLLYWLLTYLLVYDKFILEMAVYFISNLVNLNDELYQFQENDTSR